MTISYGYAVLGSRMTLYGSKNYRDEFIFIFKLFQNEVEIKDEKCILVNWK